MNEWYKRGGPKQSNAIITCNWCGEKLHTKLAKYWNGLFYHYDCWEEREDGTT